MKYDPKRELRILSTASSSTWKLTYGSSLEDEAIIILFSEKEFFESLVAFHNKMIGLKELSCPSTPSTTEGGTQTKSDEILVLSRALSGMRWDWEKMGKTLDLLKRRSSEQERWVKEIMHSTSIYLKQQKDMTERFSNCLSALIQEKRDSERERE